MFEEGLVATLSLVPCVHSLDEQLLPLNRFNFLSLMRFRFHFLFILDILRVLAERTHFMSSKSKLIGQMSQIDINIDTCMTIYQL